MFLDKLLNKIPYFRNKRIAKIKKDLVAIKEDFANGFFNDEYLISLHNIANSPLIAFTEDIVYGTMKEITVRTKSSVSAYKLLEKKVFKKSDLERSPLISMVQNTGYFTEWYSNEESLMNFITVLKSYLAAQIWLNNNPEFELHEEVDLTEFGDIDAEMFDTLLYRLLLEDLVSIISFYLEIQYE
jgi:hypothetical protein